MDRQGAGTAASPNTGLERFSRTPPIAVVAGVLLFGLAAWPTANLSATDSAGLVWGLFTALLLTSGFTALVVLVRRDGGIAQSAWGVAPAMVCVAVTSAVLVRLGPEAGAASANQLSLPSFLGNSITVLIVPGAIALGTVLGRRGLVNPRSLTPALVGGAGLALLALLIGMELAPVLSRNDTRVIPAAVIVAWATGWAAGAIAAIGRGLARGSVLHLWTLTLIVAYWVAALLRVGSPEAWTYGDIAAIGILVVTQAFFLVALTVAAARPVRTADGKYTEEDLLQALETLEQARESSPVGWLEVDRTGTITTANRSAEVMLDWNDLEGQPLNACVQSPPPGEVRRIVPDLLGGALEPWDAVWVLRRGSEGTMRVRVVAAVVPDRGQGPRILLQLINEEDRLRALDELARSEARFRRAMQASPIGMAIVGLDGQVQEVNASLARLLGYDEADRRAVVGARLSDLVRPDDDLGPPDSEPLLEGAESARGHWRLRRRDGEELYVDLSRSIIRDHRRTPLHYIVQAVDVTAEREMQELLVYRSTHDSLTGLLNRDFTLERLAGMLAESNPLEQVAVLYLDIDGFQKINDGLGHDAGDELLLSVSERLRRFAGDRGLVGRVGGDQFAVLLRGVRSRTEAERAAAEVIESIADEVPLSNEISVTPSCCVGVALGTTTTAALDLLRDADLALYEAKRQGRAGWYYHRPDLQEQTRDRVRVEAVLRDALERGEIETWFQPVADSTTLEVLGYESLIRWRDPDRGLVVPSDFLLVAEESGYMRSFGRKVLSDAMSVLRILPEGMFVTVNASGNELRHADFRTAFLTAIDGAGVAPSSIILEVTEQILLELPSSAEQMLVDFDRLGVRLFLDDFGTGYSSIQHLRQLPISGLKLDRVFVRDIATDPEARRLAKGVAELARALDLDMVAEGVENQESLHVLRDLGWPKVQGYLIGKPRRIDHPNPDPGLRVVR